MKRHNSQSLDRKVKRGHIRFKEFETIKNADGTNKILMQRKTTRGKWINA
jgi:hypothetical protein